MKKVKYILFALLLFLITKNVNAASITEVKYVDDKISINGAGTGEIQIVLFGLDNSPLYFTTVTAESDKFSITLPKIEGLKEGKYNVKVADYNGTNADTKSVEITPTESIKNPQTYDGIKLYVILAIISLIGIISMIVVIRKKLKN